MNKSEAIGKFDLRIGNWVETDKGKAFQIENGWEIDEGEEVYPIPLTEEWLVKLGFIKEDGRDWFFIEYENKLEGKNKTYRLGYNTASKYCGAYEVSSNSDLILRELQYVHQLQNLYFALTGTELI